MKKYLLSFGVIIAFTFYTINVKMLGTTTREPLTLASSPAPVTAILPKAHPAATSAGQYKNGTYTGQVADAYYGNVQVAAVISNGKLADVQILDYPQDRNRSMMINHMAMPILKQEAIQAQNAQVNTVSGATASSAAFQQSLASGLAQAQN